MGKLCRQKCPGVSRGGGGTTSTPGGSPHPSAEVWDGGGLRQAGGRLQTTPEKPPNSNGGGGTNNRAAPEQLRRWDCGAGALSKRIPGTRLLQWTLVRGVAREGCPYPPGPHAEPLQGQSPRPGALRWGWGNRARCLPGTGCGVLCPGLGPMGAGGRLHSPWTVTTPPAPPRHPGGEKRKQLFPLSFCSPSSFSVARQPQADEELLPAIPSALLMSRQPSDQATPRRPHDPLPQGRPGTSWRVGGAVGSRERFPHFWEMLIGGVLCLGRTCHPGGLRGVSSGPPESRRRRQRRRQRCPWCWARPERRRSRRPR